LAFSNNYLVFNTFAHYEVGSVYNGLLQYIANSLFNGTRFKTKVISTYNKAVQTYIQNDKFTQYYPVLCVDPSFPIGPAEMENQQLQRYPTAANMVSSIYEPIFANDDIRIFPGFYRFVSSITVIMWFDSVFEHFDAQLRVTNAFRGIGRVYRPYTVNTYSPMPYKILTEQSDYVIPIDTIAPVQILETIGKEYHLLPIILQPYFKLTNIGDGSEKYGRNDIPEIRLTFDLEVECDILTFYKLETDWKINKIILTPIAEPVGIISTGSNNDMYPPDSGKANPDAKPFEENINDIILQQDSVTNKSGKSLFIPLYKNKPVDISDKIAQGFKSVRVIADGLELIAGYTVNGNVYTLTSYDKGYLLLFNDVS